MKQVIFMDSDFVYDCFKDRNFRNLAELQTVCISMHLLLQTTIIHKFQGHKFSQLSKFSTFFFSIWVFCQEHSRIAGLQEKGEGISLTPHYHFNPLRRHLRISRAITAGGFPLRIASSCTRTGNPWFPSASC